MLRHRSLHTACVEEQHADWLRHHDLPQRRVQHGWQCVLEQDQHCLRGLQVSRGGMMWRGHTAPGMACLIYVCAQHVIKFPSALHRTWRHLVSGPPPLSLSHHVPTLCIPASQVLACWQRHVQQLRVVHHERAAAQQRSSCISLASTSGSSLTVALTAGSLSLPYSPGHNHAGGHHGCHTVLLQQRASTQC